ncbi:MAG TPA: TMEM175 family protein [Flavitalea sp.]|nr:TMEM175 family protein [Flavitalea sp.]
MNSRLEMFCDGVFAIAITLLILEIRVPPVDTVHSVADVWHALGHLWPSFFAVVLSFTIILISWLGHNNLLKLTDSTSSQFQLANGYFMFTIILMPFSTAFMAEYLNTPFAKPSIVFFCLNSLLHNTGWNLLHRSIIKPNSLLKDSIAMGIHKKARQGAKYGFFVYGALTLLALWLPYVAIVISVLTWVYWLYLSLGVRHPALTKDAESRHPSI